MDNKLKSKTRLAAIQLVSQQLVNNQDIERMSSMALDDPCTPGNPKKLVLDDMVSMYEHSVQGKLF